MVQIMSRLRVNVLSTQESKHALSLYHFSCFAKSKEDLQLWASAGNSHTQKNWQHHQQEPYAARGEKVKEDLPASSGDCFF
jgi:hypothetical protein